MHAWLGGYHLDPKGLLHTIYCFPEIRYIFFSEYSQNYPQALKRHHQDAAQSSWLIERDCPSPTLQLSPGNPQCVKKDNATLLPLVITI